MTVVAWDTTHSHIWTTTSGLTATDTIRYNGIGIAIDIGNSLIWWWNPFTALWNNSSSADPGSGTGGLTFTVTGAVFPAITTGASGNQMTANFGASTFQILTYPPTGFSAWGSSCTWDPSHKGANQTLSNGNLTCEGGTGSYQSCFGTVSHSSGKFYFEASIDVVTTTNLVIGICNSSQALNTYIGSTPGNGCGWQSSNPALGISGNPGIGTYNGALPSNGANAGIWRIGLANVGYSSGKYYYEFQTNPQFNPGGGDGDSEFAGCATYSQNLVKYLGQAGTNSFGYQGHSGNGIHYFFYNGTTTQLDIYVATDWIGTAVDLTNQLVWFYVPTFSRWNGSATANPATGTGGVSFSGMSGTVYPAFAMYSNNGPGAVLAHFQTSSFVNPAPSGFLPWDPTMNTVASRSFATIIA